MFENVKARFAKLEEDHESVRSAKQHVEKYQIVYATVGGSAITLVAVKLFGKPQVIVKGDGGLPAVIHNTINNTPLIAPVMNNIGNAVNNAGRCTKVVQDLENGDLWSKISELAEELAEEHDVTYDAARIALSRHLNGKRDQVFGRQYRTIALGTTG